MDKSAESSANISPSRCAAEYHIVRQKHPVADSADRMQSCHPWKLSEHRLGSGDTRSVNTETRNNSLMDNYIFLYAEATLNIFGFSF